MNVWTVAGVVVLGYLTAAPTPVLACESNRGSVTDVSTMWAAPATRLDVGASALPRHRAEGAAMQLGATVAQLRVSLDIQLTPAGTGAVDCWRAALHVRLQLEPHQIYVAKEFAADECARDEVTRHEQRHASVNQRTLAAAQSEVRKLLRESLDGRLARGEFSTVHEWLYGGVSATVLKLANSTFELGHVQHREIDSEAEYKRLSSVCGGRLVPLLLAGRHGGT